MRADGHDRTPDAVDLVGLLADDARRRVVAALILQAGDIDHLLAATSLDARATFGALNRLMKRGLVERGSDGTYVVVEAAFARAARHADRGERSVEHDDEPDQIRRVLETAIVDGRLVHLPTKRSKRLIVLDRLAQEFEPGVRYRERQVNATLRAFDDDVAALRRYLVDEGFLDRGEGEYWRSGGRVEG